MRFSWPWVLLPSFSIQSLHHILTKGPFRPPCQEPPWLTEQGPGTWACPCSLSTFCSFLLCSFCSASFTNSCLVIMSSLFLEYPVSSLGMCLLSGSPCFIVILQSTELALPFPWRFLYSLLLKVGCLSSQGCWKDWIRLCIKAESGCQRLRGEGNGELMFNR